MTSLIDTTKPVYGNPTTQSVRDNFLHAYDEITDLQAKTAQAPFLPVAGGTMNGAITMQQDPLNPMEVATKRYIDNLAFGQSGTVPEAPTDGLYYARGQTAGGNTWSHDPLFSSVHFGPNKDTDRFNIGSDATYNFLKMSTGNDFLRLNRSNSTFETVVGNTVIQSWSSANSTFTVPIVLPADPTGSLQAATKQYVDTNSITQAAADTRYVNTTGDTMSGDLVISKSIPLLYLNAAAAGQERDIIGRTNNLNRWSIILGNSAPETGSNAGSEFVISRFNDAGAYLDSPISMLRSNGRLGVNNGITINGSDVASLEAGASGYAIIRYNNSQHQWWMGNTNTGNFIVSDVTAGRTMMTLDSNGNATFPTVYANYLNSSGAADVAGNMAIKGASGINYANTSNYFRFYWESGFVGCCIDNSVFQYLASTSYVSANYVTRRVCYSLGLDLSTNWYYGSTDGGSWFYARVEFITCDERIKTNVAPTKVDALATICALPVEEWTTKPEVVEWFKLNKDEETKRKLSDNAFVRIGITAQRAKEIAPDLVYVADQSKPIEGKPEGSPLPDDLLQCDSASFMPYFVRAIQQLNDKITALESKQ